MNKLTKKQFLKNIITFFEKESKMSISEAKRKITKQLESDKYENDIIVSNVKLFYTDNNNFAGGIKRGYGKGFYIEKTGFNNSEIKV